MNVYDFDKTLYPRDSTLEFYLISLLRHPSFLLDLPRTLSAFVKKKRGKISLQRLREISLSSFRRLRDPEGEAERFWAKRRHRLFPYYEAIRREVAAGLVQGSFRHAPHLQQGGLAEIAGQVLIVEAGEPAPGQQRQGAVDLGLAVAGAQPLAPVLFELG